MKASSQRLVFWVLSIYALSTLTSMAGMSLGVGILLAGTLGLLVCERRRTLTESWSKSDRQVQLLFIASVTLIGVCIASLVSGKLFPLQFAGRDAQVRLASDSFKAWYLFLPFWLGFLFKQLNEQRRLQVIRTWLWAGGIVGFIGIIQFFTGWPRHQEIPIHPGLFHATLFFGHHLSTASILIFPFFVALTMAASPSESGRDKRRFFMFALCMGASLIFTWSRMLWVALPVGLFVWLFKRLKMAQIALVGLVMVGLVFGAMRLPPIQERIANGMGTNERIELWKANWFFFTQRPLLGVGWRKAQTLSGAYFEQMYPSDWRNRFVGHAHNNLLEMLGGVGIIGTLIWFYWNFLILKMCLSMARRPDGWGDYGWGIFCAWIVFHLNGLTQVNFWEGKVLHQMMWTTSLLLAGRSSIFTRESKKLNSQAINAVRS